MPSKARAAATVTAAEAWEECLARRGLAERPGRLELQAPQKQKPDLQEVPFHVRSSLQVLNRSKPPQRCPRRVQSRPEA